MQLIIDPCGSVHCVYAETINLAEIGRLTISRASHVEPDDAGDWLADLAPDRGRENRLIPGSPSLRTVRAVLPHTALQSVVSIMGLDETAVSLAQAAKPMLRKVGIRPANRATKSLAVNPITLQ